MKIDRFRSAWGIAPGPNMDNWAQWFPELKAQGYSGVEVDIHPLEPSRDFPRLRELCNQTGLELGLMIHSSWFQYLGPRPAGTKADHHLQNYRSLLKSVQQLKPSTMNFQSGEDLWDVEESIKFYKGTIQIDSELGISGRVYHETHRNRSLFTPYATRRILEAVPNLRITADFSHWMVGCERVLDLSERDKVMMDAIIPHVYHIHARIGTTQASQCPEPTNPVFKEEKECFERIWKDVIRSRVKDGATTRIVFVPEYGPFPYHPIGSTKTHSQVADEEGQRLQVLFNDFAATLNDA
ncbi:hypothetical protein N7471_006273 [Penicillium samsonianum]|uniref:uncharacterized protein n=1 Tax=Penicillium samsonianum TaxID=1882272 RepID=UPI0025471922|nr:uncharacterized protein N7471_006273 [Penicillium samsonianum]KAJ6139787.1 hypothetical protein N7471_006273 [Penicillium samsonianum]